MDYQALLAYRSRSSVIITSAATARVDQYHLTSFAPLVFVSQSGDFSDIPALTELSETKHSAETWKEPNGRWNVRELARQRNWPRVLFETGPTLSKVLIESGQVDSVMLTITDAGTLSPESACDRALGVLGASNRDLVWADRVDRTLLTEWRINAAWQGVQPIPLV